eukprot:NODE_884_length_3321_cov_0.260708.p2 type:complete len:261 gc:universal NODE_884_length_3321_cov_0.260708:3122-2340(-)
MIWIVIIYAACRVSQGEYDIGHLQGKILYSCDPMKSKDLKLKKNGIGFVKGLLMTKEIKFDSQELDALSHLHNYKAVLDKLQKYRKQLYQFIWKKWGINDLFCHDLIPIHHVQRSIFPNPLHEDRMTAKNLKVRFDILVSKFHLQLTAQQNATFEKYYENDALFDMFNLWINVGSTIKDFPLVIAPNNKPKNTLYYFENMEYGDAIFFDATNLHGTLGTHLKLDKVDPEREVERKSIVFSCTKLPSDLLNFVKSFKQLAQ